MSGLLAFLGALPAADAYAKSALNEHLRGGGHGQHPATARVLVRDCLGSSAALASFASASQAVAQLRASTGEGIRRGRKGPAIGPRPGRRIAVSQAPPRPIIRYGRGRDGGRTAAQLAAKAIRCPPGTNQQRARCPARPRQWPSAGLPCGPVEQVLARAFRPRPLRAGPPARRQGRLDGLISERRRCRRRCPSLQFSLPMAPRGNRAIAAGVQLRSGALRSPQRPAARLAV